MLGIGSPGDARIANACPALHKTNAARHTAAQAQIGAPPMTKSLTRGRAPWLSSCVLLGLSALQAHAADTAAAPSLVPLPANYQASTGKDFVLKGSDLVGGNDEAAHRTAGQFVQMLARN